ncbi:MAG TPA: hypothetical protein PK251_12445 [Candidatus Latescibacteria bacterium]|nr:hypothetical protein [Candidatus Latescibacterota bacterium]HPK75615.1 hypothetical protein [Candidatus Latescibacterota bacterium]
MSSESNNNENPAPSTRTTGGIAGWIRRLVWRRNARRMKESDIDLMRKRIIIITSQLQQLPDSSTVLRRRKELLRDRERCEFVIAEWERRYDRPKDSR